MQNQSLSRRSLLAHTAAGLAVAGFVPRGLAAAESTPAEKPKGRIRQSASRWCYGKMSLDDLCKNAVRIGLQGLDLVKPDEWPTIKKYGLACTMVPGCGSVTEGLNHKENHAAQITEMHKNIDLAADAGAPNVICFSGNSKGISREDGLRNCVEAIKQFIGHAEKRNINVCMEYLNSKRNHKDYQFDHTAVGGEIARQVGSPRFGILYDIYHAQIMEGAIIQTIRDNHQYFLHYHTGGNPGRHEIDDTQEIYYPPIMKAIVETGYKGYVAHEFTPKRDPMTSLEQAFRICDV